MYKHILIPLENSRYDTAILAHIRPLARLMQSRITLIHVADGFMARNQNVLGESAEIREDTDYLEKVEAELRSDGFDAKAHLAYGEPSKEILAFAEKEQCDLIAMPNPF